MITALSISALLLMTACSSSQNVPLTALEESVSAPDPSAASTESVPDSKQASEQSLPASSTGIVHLAASWQSDPAVYTDADYALALSFQTEGCLEQSVETFDKNFMDWENEDAYHRMEDAMTRLCSSLPENDPNASFIFGTLVNSWESCQKKHYQTCGRETMLQHNGWAALETYGDIYGDSVLLSGSYVEFGFNYQIPDEKALTVGERDTLLAAVRDGLKQYLENASREELADITEMETALKKELKRLLSAPDNKIVWGQECSLSYRRNAPYEIESALYAAQNNAQSTDSLNYQSCYDLVLTTLPPDRCMSMSVAEFDRLVNTAWQTDDGRMDSFPAAWEVVVNSLPETDPHFSFFHTTLPAALAEYQARAQSVYTQTQVDPSHSGRLFATLKEDVFGDALTVAQVSADYSLSYRILDADKLTVQERDRFFTETETKAQNLLTEKLKTGTVKEADVKNALETAGKESGSSLISFIECEIDFFEIQIE